MRIQGLPGSYTQLLREGLPLFGGYAYSFSVLQIPTLDLKQIEIIKGSTLYGGGPGFKEIWTPLDGRVANLSVRMKF